MFKKLMPMKKKILLFTEFSKKLGKGHLYRSLQIFKKIEKKYTCRFLVNKNLSSINKILRKNSHNLVIYDFKKYSKKLFKNDTKYIAFDNKQKFHKRLININPLELSKKDYSGPKWYPYPESFFSIKKKRQKKYTLFINQGATDAFNNLSKIIKCLEYLDSNKINRCIIKTPKRLKLKLYNSNNIKIKQFTYVKKISEIYKKADLAISGCGNFSYELSFFGIPCVLVSSEKTEILRGKYFHKKGNAKFYKPDKLKEISIELNKLSNNYSYYKKIREKNIKNFKKNGLKNIYLLINKYINEI